MSKRCYGEFLCAFCGRVTKQAFDISTPEELDALGVNCKCGHFIQQYIPTSMRNGLLTLASKGYRIKLINEKTVGVVFDHKLTQEELNKLPQLPYEFSYDMTEPEGDMLVNARIQAMDFEGLDEQEYYQQAINNFTDWCALLPTIRNGEYIDLTAEESD